MRNNKTKIGWEKFIAFIFSILGFSGCNDEFEQTCLYGSPNVDYTVKISVTDEDNAPISDIQATFYQSSYVDYSKDTLYSNKNGEINGIIKYYSTEGGLKIKLEDVDGEFETREIIFNNPRTNKIKDDSDDWNRGMFLLEETIKMEKK
jgi:putative lipoprotein (rSAM/lipoprotein system)